MASLWNPRQPKLVGKDIIYTLFFQLTIEVLACTPVHDALRV